MRKSFATSMLLSLAAIQLETSTVNALQVYQPQPAPVHTNTIIDEDWLPLKIKSK